MRRVIVSEMLKGIAASDHELILGVLLGVLCLVVSHRFDDLRNALSWLRGRSRLLRSTTKRSVGHFQAHVFDTFASSRMYEDAVNKTFEEIDFDGSGSIDETEGYVGVLLIFDRINKRLPTHETPPSRRVVEKIMRAFDADGSGKLDRSEFMALAKAMFDPSEGGSASGIVPRIIQNIIWSTVVLPLSAYVIRSAIVVACDTVLGGQARWASSFIQTYVPIAVIAPIISVIVTMAAKTEEDTAALSSRSRQR